ncbi:hypothetical protein ACJX0J_019585, partial [Zea mays]
MNVWVDPESTRAMRATPLIETFSFSVPHAPEFEDEVSGVSKLNFINLPKNGLLVPRVFGLWLKIGLYFTIMDKLRDNGAVTVVPKLVKGDGSVQWNVSMSKENKYQYLAARSDQVHEVSGVSKLNFINLPKNGLPRVFGLWLKIGLCFTIMDKLRDNGAVTVVPKLVKGDGSVQWNASMSKENWSGVSKLNFINLPKNGLPRVFGLWLKIGLCFTIMDKLRDNGAVTVVPKLVKGDGSVQWNVSMSKENKYQYLAARSDQV